MFNDYEDITERIAEPPKWWDEYGVPRYAEYGPYQVANIYAQETALVEIACSACWRHFEVAFSIPGTGLQETIGKCSSLAEAIEKGEITMAIRRTTVTAGTARRWVVTTFGCCNTG